VNTQNKASASTDTLMSALREPDRFLQETVAGARADWERCRSDLTHFAQREPETALLSALAAGYLLRMLPVAGMVRLSVRLALALVKPAALVYGGAKIWEKVRNDAQTGQITKAVSASRVRAAADAATAGE
jgi:hypothetical protein